MKNKIKTGSWVKVIIPKFVERVGYPNSIEHYSKIAETDAKLLLNSVFRKLFPCWNSSLDSGNWRTKKAQEEIYRSLGWAMAHADGWGGRKRTIHFIEKPEFLNAEGWAQNFKRCVTGTYSPGYRSGGYGYEEWNPPYLYDQKHHRLVQLCGLGVPNDLWIPDYHLEIIK